MIGVLGPPIDAWALGVTYFALIQGRLPFSGDNGDGLDNYTTTHPHMINHQKENPQTWHNILHGVYTVSSTEKMENIGKIRCLLRKIFTRSPAQRPDMAKMYGLFNGYIDEDEESNGDDDEGMGAWSEHDDEEEEEDAWTNVNTQSSSINSRYENTHLNPILTTMPLSMLFQSYSPLSF